VDDSLTTYPRW